MHRVWQFFDPRRTLIALFGFLSVLALLIHFIVFVSPGYSWLDTSSQIVAPSDSMLAMPPARNIN
jgi:light-harvesting complex 1 alpha chain